MSETRNPAFSPDNCHDILLRERPPLLRYREGRDLDTWRSQVRSKLTELLGDMPERVPLNLRIEWESDTEEYHEYRIVYDVEHDTSMPAHLLVPHKAVKPCAAVICIQGHGSGMHISLARPLYKRDLEILGGDGDYAIQAIRQGYAALVIEQRAFGQRFSPKEFDSNYPWKTTCQVPAMTALLLGRTLLGERVWDISRSIDALVTFPEIDPNRIGCMGHSGGGTATYYAACLDERISIAMPSCAVCSFSQSIGTLYHCACNYIPSLGKYVDMGDLAVLIAPRPLVVVAGAKDGGFLLPGVEAEYGIIKKIYAEAGAADACALVVGPEGHRFYAEPSWDVFRQLSGW